MVVQTVQIGSEENTYQYESTDRYDAPGSPRDGELLDAISVSAGAIYIEDTPTNPKESIRKEDLDEVLQIISVADIDDPSTEFAALDSGTGGAFLVAYEAEANEDQSTIYLWDSAVGTGANTPYAVSGNTGFWVAVAGKYAQPSAAIVALNEPTGFMSRTTSTLSFVAGTRTFTITPTGANFVFWQRGFQYTQVGADSLIIADTSGEHWIHYDGGTLTDAVNPSHATKDGIYVNKVPVSIVYWNATDGDIIILGEDRHNTIMDGVTHHWGHDGQGVMYPPDGGLNLTDYVLDTDSDAALTFEVTDGRIYDESLEIEIENGSAANPFEQILNGADAQVPVIHRDNTDGTWHEVAASTLPYLTTGSGRLAYNNDDGDGTWSQVEVSNVRFMSYTLIATSDQDLPIKMIQGQMEFTSLSNAVEEATNEILAFGNLPTPETIILFRLVMQTGTGYGGTKKAKIASITDFRRSRLVGTSAAAQDHGSLGGLSDVEDHGGYLDLAGARPMVGDLEIVDPTSSTGITIDNSSSAVTLLKSVHTGSRTNEVLGTGGTGALDFDGTGDYIEITDSLNDQDNLSISMWVNMDDWASGADEGILFTGSLNQNGHISISKANNDFLRFRLFDADATSRLIQINVSGLSGWHHILCVLSKTDTVSGSHYMELYIDGSNAGNGYTATTSPWTASVDTNFRIGADSNGNFELFGLLDELSIWTEILSANDISDLYNAGNGLFFTTATTWPTDGGTMGTNLFGLWHFNDGAGDTLTDSSGNGIDGALNPGSGQPAWVSGHVPSIGSIVAVNIWTSINGVAANEQGIITYGDDDAQSIFNGQTITFHIGGVEVGDVDSSGDWTVDGGLNVTGAVVLDTTLTVTGLITGAATNNIFGDNTNVSPNASGDGHIRLDASGYSPYWTADGTAVYFGHNSGSRGLVLQTNETDRLSITGAGVVTIAGATILDSTLDVAGAAVFNEAGADIDFRVEGVGEVNALFLQGSDGFVGLGTGTPTYRLDVVGDAGFEEYLYHNDDADTHIRFLDDSITLTAGNIPYITCTEAATDTLILNIAQADIDTSIRGAGRTEALFVQGSNGFVGVNDGAPGFDFDVNGDVNATGDYHVGDTKVIGAQGAGVANPAGGGVVDVQCRAQLVLLLARFRASTGHGSIAG